MRTLLLGMTGLTGLTGLFLLLSIPDRAAVIPAAPSRRTSFSWHRDDFWASLEREFQAFRAAGCAGQDSTTSARLASIRASLAEVTEVERAVTDPVFDSLEHHFLALAPAVAACPAHAAAFVHLSGQIRDVIKWQSRGWDVSQAEVRARLYRSLYGARAAAEEILLHHPEDMGPVLFGRDEPSATPSTVVHGVRIHSGDILISRGGYPTSALIARGNDYPGNFSHIALVHVDGVTHTASTIEAHIERGVAISTAAEYLGDKKLRILVLRPRADLPALVRDPMLPHRAATLALERARREHIPYDFAMDYTDPSRLFCSEVASAAYHQAGLDLWMGISTISNPGLRRWLAAFGVRHFETQEPSDLEYDPQLVAVAEWRDPGALWSDHVDNAVIDAMLEGAERGDQLTYPWYKLPLVRIAKGYSWVLARFHASGPVPEGMSASAALRNREFGNREVRLAGQVRGRADSLWKADGYPPPYWKLVAIARQAIAAYN